jgi:hypothetical protein
MSLPLALSVTLRGIAARRHLISAHEIPAALLMIACFLMMKGAELRLDADIDSLVVSDGEFIVLVPFPRKSGQAAPVAMPGEEGSANPPTCRCSWKRRKLCKENGNSSRGASGVDGASGQPTMSKKSGFVKSAVSPCHVGFSRFSSLLCVALSILP